MEMPDGKIAIIGGGAAGLAAAVAAGERARQIGASIDIAVYERDDRVGRSILATGNGRCNFSNEHVRASDYHNAAFAGAVLDALAAGRGPDAVRDFFEAHGLAWRQEADGRRYPLANKASVVVDVLRSAAKQVGVREKCEWPVKTVVAPRKAGKQFTLHRKDGVLDRADAVIIACGGRALRELDVDVRDDCLRRLAQHPMLGPLQVAEGDKRATRELDNIRVRCGVRLMRGRQGAGDPIAAESGELMFRKYGVSGICVFDLSRFAQPGDTLVIDFLQRGGIDQTAAFLETRRARLADLYGDALAYEDMLRGLVLPRVADVLLKRANVDARKPFDRACVPELAHMLSAFSLEVAGIADPDLCQVRRGGFAVDDFDPSSLMARDVPGLFAVGEALDVDGPCGGFNLHWAWGCGLLSGAAAVDRLCGPRDAIPCG